MRIALINALVFALLGAPAAFAGECKGKPYKLGFFNGAAATCASAMPCREVNSYTEKEYYSYISEGFNGVKATLPNCSSEEFQNKLLNYYDGLSARDLVLGLCYGRCTNYDQPQMLWHATTETARREKLDAIIDARYVYYGAQSLFEHGIDVTAPVTSGLLQNRR